MQFYDQYSDSDSSFSLRVADKIRSTSSADLSLSFEEDEFGIGKS